MGNPGLKTDIGGIYACSLHDVIAELRFVVRYHTTAKQSYLRLRATYAFFRGRMK